MYECESLIGWMEAFVTILQLGLSRTVFRALLLLLKLREILIYEECFFHFSTSTLIVFRIRIIRTRFYFLFGKRLSREYLPIVNKST